MIEKLIYLDTVDVAEFCGVNNTNFDLLCNHYPKLKIVCRGNWIKACGEEEEIATFEEKVGQLIQFQNHYNKITADKFTEILSGQTLYQNLQEAGTIVYSVDGHPIKARSENQQKLVVSASKNDMLFAVGPAGSGKTYLAIALAVAALKSRRVKRIILSRPAVEAGEKLGFLPGDMKEKIDPYLQPLYDALADMIPASKLKEYLENGTIQIAPLAFMRGRTLNNAFVILDEAQNTTIPQIKMFLTRMGTNAKFVITGDYTQIDLPPSQKSGLIYCLRILRGIEGLAVVEFGREDIVRHRLVQKIVEAFDNDKNNQNFIENGQSIN